MSLFLDTGAVELLRRRDRRAESIILRHYPPVVCTHVLGEFMFGQYNAGARGDNLKQAREFVTSFELVIPNQKTAEIYGRLRADLVRRGLKFSDPDYWIAAHVLEGNHQLLSTDRHFLRIDGMAVHHLNPDKFS